MISTVPLTDSENVAVTVNPVLVGSGVPVDVRTTDGRVASYVRTNGVAAVLSMSPALCAAPVPTLTVTRPSIVGVTKAVYTVELTQLNAEPVPLVIVKPVRSMPLTGSENVAVTVNPVFVGSGAPDDRITDGVVTKELKTTPVFVIVVAGFPAVSVALNATL